jgi:hypothetical protein
MATTSNTDLPTANLPPDQSNTHESNVSECHVDTPPEQSTQTDRMSDAFHRQLSLLRDATRRAVVESYTERERLFRDGEMMQVRYYGRMCRSCDVQVFLLLYLTNHILYNLISLLKIKISYLKAKIEAAKNELILQGKLQPDTQTATVPVIEEEKSGEFTASDDSIHSQFEQLVDDQHGSREASHYNRNASAESRITGLSRGSMLSMLANHNSSQNESLSASARFSLFEEVGMPSRWKAREMEKQTKQEEDDEDDTKNSISEHSQDTFEHGNGLLHKIKKLLSQRESEIAILEQQTKTMERETSLIRNQLSEMNKEHETSMTIAQRERDTLLENIRRIESDNDTLDAMILETGILLQEKEIGGHLLEKELRVARNELYELQNRKKAHRSRGRGGEPANYTNSGGITHRVPLNDAEEGDRKGSGGRMPRRGSNTSVMSNSTAMSALTLDFDDIVDILDSSRREDDDFDILLDSLTSRSGSGD